MYSNTNNRQFISILIDDEWEGNGRGMGEAVS